MTQGVEKYDPFARAKSSLKLHLCARNAYPTMILIWINTRCLLIQVKIYIRKPSAYEPVFVNFGTKKINFLHTHLKSVCAHG